jgi:hypothetical protein
MTDGDAVVLTFPREREFQRVAHLVLGGLALRLHLTIEALEDLQLALTAVLDRGGPGDEVTVSLTVAGGALEAAVGPVDLERLPAEDGAELGLSRILAALADDVRLDGDRVVLTKRLAA